MIPFLNEPLLMFLMTALSLILLIQAPLSAETEMNGFVEYYHSFKNDDISDFTSSRSRFKLDLYTPAFAKESDLFFSFSGLFNRLDNQESGFYAEEFYIDTTFKDWDFRIGRQLIIWGKADGIAISDFISPRDMTEFLARDYDDTRMPVTAVKAVHSNEAGEMELIFIPLYRQNKMARPGSVWAMSNPFKNYNIDFLFSGLEKPAHNLKNSEYAFKFSRYLEGIDYSLGLFYSWEDNPVYRRTPDRPQNRICITPETTRYKAVSFECAKASGDFVYRTEFAYQPDKIFLASDIWSNRVFKKDVLNWMFGVDWAMGNTWNLTAQITDKMVLGLNPLVLAEEHDYLGTLSLGKNFWNETLDLRLMYYADFTYDSGFARFSGEYSVSDSLRVSMGTDIFYGSKGVMGEFNENDSIWIKTKYLF